MHLKCKSGWQAHECCVVEQIGAPAGRGEILRKSQFIWRKAEKNVKILQAERMVNSEPMTVLYGEINTNDRSTETLELLCSQPWVIILLSYLFLLLCFFWHNNNKILNTKSRLCYNISTIRKTSCVSSFPETCNTLIVHEQCHPNIKSYNSYLSLTPQVFNLQPQ